MKIYILYSVTFFRKSCRLCDNVEKCSGAIEAINGNVAVRFMLD